MQTMDANAQASPSRLAAGQRWLSFAELIVASAIVIAHNVFRAIPNEVPILFVIGLISLRVRDGWSVLGLGRPASWLRTILIALGAATLRIALGDFVIDPLSKRFFHPMAEPAGVSSIPGHWKLALAALAFVWTFAAFGEEIAYRGYLLTRAADLGGRSKSAYWLGLLYVSVLFGYGHYYKGPAGILDSAIAGLILGAAYLLSGRNLWVAILGHGFIDTIALAALYFGWSTS
jgi:membrane protease YdiL (CAAX protease family)